MFNVCFAGFKRGALRRLMAVLQAAEWKSCLCLNNVIAMNTHSKCTVHKNSIVSCTFDVTVKKECELDWCHALQWAISTSLYS